MQLDIPVLYLSKAIIEARQDYYRLLLNVSRDAAWEPWILFMLDAVRSTAQWTTSRIKAIRALIDADIAQRQTASVYLKQLVDIGLLREMKAGREKLFINPHLIQALSVA